MAIRIITYGSDRTIRFAARELARGLEAAGAGEVSVAGAQRVAPGGRRLHVGVSAGFGVTPPRGVRDGDDWVCVTECDDGYVLTGANPRSVLFAVYRFLHALGFRWIRPGKRGEIVPRLAGPVPAGIRIHEAPSCRYRTVCIEGACSEQHVCDLIDWMARHGMNGYFIQFELGTEFWARWYRHESNPRRKPERLDAARLKRIVARVEREVAKRGLRLERMGHGWTCAPLGIRGEGWSPSGEQVPPEKTDWLAQVDGERRLWQGVPLNTNLCYANPDVRSAMLDAVLEYARAHARMTELHLWLADGSNNNCECEACRQARPSDFYVQLLNELDAALTREELDTRIVFLIYVDLLWPPLRARLRNPDRFTLMFAPITRDYRQSFADALREPARMQRFERNKLRMPRTAAANLAYLAAWRKVFKGDGFDFDYHGIWACFFDPSQFTLARVLHRDIQSLRKIELDGFNSCQNQRLSFPHNLLMDVMARTLWNRRVPFKRIVEETFCDAFGPDGPAAAAGFATLSRLWRPLFNPLHLDGDEPRRAAARRNLRAMPAELEKMRALIERNRNAQPEAVRWSWRYAKAYCDLMDLLIPAFESYAELRPDARERFVRVFDWLWRTEPRLHPALDAWEFVKVLDWRINEVEAWLRERETV